jgi:hypothetical protein
MTTRSGRAQLVLALLGGLAVAGCSSAIDGGIAEPTVAPGEFLAIDNRGVGAITAATPFSQAAVEQAMPGYDASQVTMATETRTVDGLALFRDGLQVVQVVPGDGGRIGSVHGVSARVRGPGGARIGMSLGETRLPRTACRAGAGNWAGMPICTAPGAPNVSYVFAFAGVAAADGLPDDATLRTATLQRIIWTAPAGSTS